MHGTNGTVLTRGQEFDEIATRMWNRANGLLFKKGGKIIKGEDGIKPWDYDNLTPEQRNKLHANLSDEEFEEYLDLIKRQKAGDDAFRINSWDSNARRYSNPFDSLYDRSNPLYNANWARLYALQHKNRHDVNPENDVNIPVVSSKLKPSRIEIKITSPDPIKADFDKTFGPQPKESITQGRAGSGMSVNFADLYDRFRALENAKGLNEQYELLDRANGSLLLQQFNVPRLNSPKLYTGREKYIADKTAANMMLESTPDMYSDSKLTAATRLSKQSQSEAMRQQGRIAETEAIIKQNAANTEVENKNKEREAEAVDKRSALLAGVKSKGWQLKADKQRVLSTKIVDPILQQFAQQRRDEMNKLDALFQQAKVSEKERQANEWMMNELRNNTLYQTWKNSED